MDAIPDWQGETRFFVPNEDAEVVRMALGMLPKLPQNSLFITGSGMLALDMLPSLPQDATVECFDVSPFQQDYLCGLINVVRAASTPQAMQRWLRNEVLPQLNIYYGARRQSYTYENVLKALESLFRIRFFFDDAHFAYVRERLGCISNHRSNILERSSIGGNYDFVHLSNIIDYLSAGEMKMLFRQCAARRAAVFCIETSACRAPEVLHKAWQEAGYLPHHETSALQSANRALGGSIASKPWMRTGSVHLLIPMN